MVRSHAEFNKKLNAFMTNETAPCWDCGMELPAGDDEARQAHFAVCPSKRVDSTLTTTESDELAACEQIIERGIKIWQEVGEALLHIRDKRLYRATHKTFEDYLTLRWQIKRPRAYELMRAASVMQNLSEISDTLPRYESHAAALSELKPEEQRIVWQALYEVTDGDMTTASLKSAVNVFKEVKVTGAIDDGTGNSIPIQQATVDHYRAAITEETYERMQRQQAHITANTKRKTKLLHNVEFDAMTEFDLADLSLMMKCRMVGKHLQIIIREVEED